MAKQGPLLRTHIQKIVKEDYNQKIKDSNVNVKVDYASLFAKTDWEFSGMYQIAKQFGEVIKYTPTEVLFQIQPLETVTGNLEILKVILLDQNHPANGDAFFMNGEL